MGGREHGQLDVREVLSFTERLRDVRDRVDHAAVSPEQRGRWQSRLAAISEGAASDLERAVGQLGRLEADVVRQVRRR
jgi:hypothetical protein